jgi:hypothetical protein
MNSNWKQSAKCVLFGSARHKLHVTPVYVNNWSDTLLTTFINFAFNYEMEAVSAFSLCYGDTHPRIKRALQITFSMAPNHFCLLPQLSHGQIQTGSRQQETRQSKNTHLKSSIYGVLIIQWLQSVRFEFSGNLSSKMVANLMPVSWRDCQWQKCLTNLKLSVTPRQAESESLDAIKPERWWIARGKKSVIPIDYCLALWRPFSRSTASLWCVIGKIESSWMGSFLNQSWIITDLTALFNLFLSSLWPLD